jgi:Cu+-exporting ATPase
MSAKPKEPRQEQGQVELAIGGMTCAACANRVEKQLNKLDGVTATVNYATEKAGVVFDGTPVATGDLIAQVERAGYTAALPEPAPRRGPAPPRVEAATTPWTPPALWATRTAPAPPC